MKTKISDHITIVHNGVNLPADTVEKILTDIKTASGYVEKNPSKVYKNAINKLKKNTLK